jgi:3',5'-cyclic AMP phosphodiesterase CpdA
VFLSPGNHETIPPATRDQYLIQFADWLNVPLLREQRLKDDPKDHKLRAYYHWVKGSVDFIALDNASADQFDAAQMKWIHAVIERDEKSNQIRTIVVGMHEALPGSLGESHSMSESAQGDRSGREVYEALLHARNSAHKHVYVFASHSHFFMEDVYRTDAWKGKVLPGWIVGTAGAVRYRLPPGVKPGLGAVTDVYGFLVATVAPDGSISTSFRQLALDDLRHANPDRPAPLVRWCYEQNKQP